MATSSLLYSAGLVDHRPYVPDELRPLDAAAIRRAAVLAEARCGEFGEAHSSEETWEET